MSADFIAPGTPMRLGRAHVHQRAGRGEYPPGIPVAFVTSVHTVAGAGQKTVHVQPIANLDQLAYVDVVLWSPSP